MADWIKCSERMPGHGEHVLVWVNVGYCYIARFDSASFNFICDEYVKCVNVTHWQPLPEPPQE